jgi:hypothetical protein
MAPPTPPSQPVSDKSGRRADKASLVVEVLMHEYDALRAEVLMRAAARFQLLGFMGVAAALLGTQNINITWRITLISLIVIVCGYLWYVFAGYANACAARQRDIEREINEMLGQTVLVWESTRRTSWDKWIRP